MFGLFCCLFLHAMQENLHTSLQILAWRSIANHNQSARLLFPWQLHVLQYINTSKQSCRVELDGSKTTHTKECLYYLFFYLGELLLRQQAGVESSYLPHTYTSQRPMEVIIVPASLLPTHQWIFLTNFFCHQIQFLHLSSPPGWLS